MVYIGVGLIGLGVVLPCIRFHPHTGEILTFVKGFNHFSFFLIVFFRWRFLFVARWSDFQLILKKITKFNKKNRQFKKSVRKMLLRGETKICA